MKPFLEEAIAPVMCLSGVQAGDDAVLQRTPMRDPLSSPGRNESAPFLQVLITFGSLCAPRRNPMNVSRRLSICSGGPVASKFFSKAGSMAGLCKTALRVSVEDQTTLHSYLPLEL